MNITVIISFLAFTLLVAAVAVYKTRNQKLGTSVAYFLGNRSFGFWMIGSSLFLTNMSANQFIGENEFVYTTNMSVMCWGMSSILAMLLVAEFLMPVYLKIGAVTTPDFLEKRFDTQTKRMVSVIFLLSYFINLIPSVLYGCAVALNGIFHIDAQVGLSYFATIGLLVLLIGVIGGMYTLLGGLKAITISDVVQGIGMLAGSLLITWYGFRYLGNGHFMAGVHRVLGEHKAHLNAIGGATDVLPFGTLFTGMLLINIYYWGMEQYIVQETLASRSLNAGQKGMALACVGKLLAPLLLNVPGLMAVHLYPHLDNTATAFPRLVSDVLPPAIAGLMAAIVFGGALSTFNAGLNSLGTLFVLNLYQPWKVHRGKAYNEKNIVKAGRRFQLLVIVWAICFSPFIMYFSGGFYNYLQKLSSFFSVPVFTIMAVGLLTRRTPPVAAKAGLVFFVVAYIITQFVIPVKLHYLHVLAILFVVTVAGMLLIGRLYPTPLPFQLQTTTTLNLQPWKNRHWYFGVLLVLMILMFMLFSPMGLAA
ncbi:SSS family solute:Na+ symporter [Filimonas zeae]|uniref:Solute:sodium symporter family transporter n=1 Tax=Filimonas zeae TaxID=1737353 RepID=A0A917J4G5_9BACT|nr:solute:sodium symporter family transporter [Filimonas zeae]MDR6342035.1 SSS family solute:Na+ symporter [Filimonas zeae]GGH79368.1 solute:sodium symporter family transporter [Filimonas zeae]